MHLDLTLLTLDFQKDATTLSTLIRFRTTKLASILAVPDHHTSDPATNVLHQAQFKPYLRNNDLHQKHSLETLLTFILELCIPSLSTTMETETQRMQKAYSDI